jgi:hypothetical protein
MYKCHFLKELNSYLDNQLSDEQRLKVEEHLKSCRTCSLELSKLKALSEKLRSWYVPDLDSGFEDLVRNKIVARELERGQVKMKKKTLILIPTSVLATILVIVCIASMQVYVKRSMQGRIRTTVDDISESFKPGDKKVRQFASLNEEHPVQSSIIDGRGMILARAGSAKRVDTAGYSGADMKYPLSQEKDESVGQGSVIVIQPVLPATGEGEKVIRTAELRLEVEDGKEAYRKASLICQEFGGYLAASNFFKDNEGRQAGTITMRIPKDKFLAALDRISALGKVENIYSNSQDVAQEYSNLKTQLDAAMIVYNKMLEALQKRQVTIPEAMKLESELTPVLKRIEDLKNKLEYLNNSVSFTTISVNFHESKVSEKVLTESKNYIQENMLKAKINSVRFFAQTIPVAVAIVIWAVILLAVALFVKYVVLPLFLRK